MKTEIYIRQMEFDDLGKVFHLGEALFTAEKWPNLYRTWDEYEIMERFISDEELCLVACDDDEKMVGFAIGSIIEKRRSAWIYGYLIWIGVDPQLKGAGIGKKLCKHMTKLFIDKGARIMIADTSKENDGAINFFRNMGFDSEDDHVYLSRNLTKTAAYKRAKKS